MLAVIMRIVRWVMGDETGLRACYEATRATARADDPNGPPMSMRTWRALLTSPTEPAQTWFVPGDTPDSILGLYHLRLPSLENRNRAWLWLEVRPEHRRRGIGLSLLRHAARQADAAGRTVFGAGVAQDSAGEAFARRFGGKPGLADARRVLVLARQPCGGLAALRSRAAAAAAGYTLVSWTDRTPDEYLAGVAAVHNAMRDAPRDPGFEATTWDAQRIREELDDQRDLFGTRGYSVAALHAATGEMAAITQIEIEPEFPAWGHQQITAVARHHRGHRLGLLVKAAMLEWLATAEPALERIVTGNAASNEHMVAINETLGFELLEPQSRRYELAVPDVLAA